ncbi:MAG TPA: isochorismatase family protein [Candidatus Deferrimicrobiaceae bacterium]|nr:isochorismatase family protein [Candidatus Deferrimicrobiaceae bacterium]
MKRVLNREDAVLVVVDVQERLVPAIDRELYERSLKNFKIVLEAAGTLGLPIVLTEQYPKGLGRTVSPVLQALEGKAYERIEKVAFSCGRDERFLAAIAKTVRHQVILVGMETHVCVYQTSVDLINAGYEVFVLDDAVSSRFPHNYSSGIASLRDAGAVVISTETAVFQMMKVAGTPEFKKISSLLR